MEISIYNLEYPMMNLDSIKWEIEEAHIIYRLLQSFGALRDCKFFLDDGRITITKRIHMNCKDEYEKELFKNAYHFYTLNNFVKIIMRFNKNHNEKIKTLGNKINKISDSMDKIHTEFKKVT